MKEEAKVPFQDFVKIEREKEALEIKLEEAKSEILQLENKIKKILEDRDSNYRRIDEMDLYGLNENEFH